MWDMFVAGGPVMWPLLICSIAALAVVLERAWFWHKQSLEQNITKVESLLEDYRKAGPDWQPEPSLKNPEPGIVNGAVMRMLISGFVHRDFSLSKAMESEALDELQKMRQGMTILDTIITAAPMLGILGTVVGIITSFDMLSQEGVEDPQAVVGGIAQALITTAAGLIISIATLFPFNYFNSRIESAQDTFENYATRLEMLQEKFDKKNSRKKE